MSLIPSPTTSTEPRKRTYSFSFSNQTPTCAPPNPRPPKAPRTTTGMGSLRRTESYISLHDLQSTASTSATLDTSSSKQPPSPAVPYHRTLHHYKEQRERRKALLNRTLEPITIRTRLEIAHTRPTAQSHAHAPQPPSTSPLKPTPLPHTAAAPPPTTSALPTVRTPRVSSPLAPTRTALPGRPVFPRSKPEPDLYRKALTTSMKGTPQGQKILHMGARLALSIMTATQELERIVAAQTEKDVQMADATPVLTKSWVVVQQGEDWEMIDCAA